MGFRVLEDILKTVFKMGNHRRAMSKGLTRSEHDLVWLH